MKKNIPIPYLTGETEFMGLKFYVDKNVMIPRQDTEILVEEVLKLFPSSYSSVPTILDIGTGSGNIAVSLAKYLSNAKIVAIDISENALNVARKNAELNNVSDKITFLQTDLFSTTYHLPLTTYDIVVSNPPYIRTNELKMLQAEIQYEPKIALDGGSDGLKFYRTIIPKSKKLLKKNGFLMFEIGYHHSEPVKKMMLETGFVNIKIVNDYSQEERVIYGQNYN